MSRYSVVGPQRYEVIAILDDGTGPMEPGRLWLELEAPNRREAVRIALRHPEARKLVDEARSDGYDPRGYIAVHRMPDGHPSPDDPTADGHPCDDCPLCSAWLRRVDDAIKRLDARRA